jgi:hypothetical protein
MLDWKIYENASVNSIQIERSADGLQFQSLGIIPADSSDGTVEYHYNDILRSNDPTILYYRLIVYTSSGRILRSQVVKTMGNSRGTLLQVCPTITRGALRIQTSGEYNSLLELEIYDGAGKMIVKNSFPVSKGFQTFDMEELAEKPNGVYLVKLKRDQETKIQKIVVTH